MPESILWQAFFAGIVSACSMPLGSLTTLIWHPRNRILAFLMAFGSGALLAALVIDLVGNATEKGHLFELVIGTIIGSLLYTFVNRLINNSGGFLRKPATMLVHLTQQEAWHFEQRVSRLKRIALFQDQTKVFHQKLAQFLLSANYPSNVTIYHYGDPSESLYLIKKGQVNLLDSTVDSQRIRHLSDNDIFGIMAFVTGCPHQSEAVTEAETEINILTRTDFETLLQISPRFANTTASYLQSQAIADYLHQRQGLTPAAAKAWVTAAVESLAQRGIIPPAVEIQHQDSEFLEIARQIRRLPVFRHLPQEELGEIAERLIYHQYPDGEVFFQPQDPCDRLYIIHEGEVEIVYPKKLQDRPIVLVSGDVFGELSFITGASHTVTAIAKTDVKIWILRKAYFEELLLKSSLLEDSVKAFLQQEKLQKYLQQRQNFDSKKAGHWVQSALDSMNASHLIPSVTAITATVEEHHDAPMAIWLGLLMDGIPESLTIGAHLAIAPLSPSLLAGLFIANYPEALSSSEGMKQQGFSFLRVFMMWASIMVITGILAGLGSIVFADVPETVVSLLGAIAAGAMLTVISETMLPEAYAKGGSVVGISTILGFLVIILIRSWASH